MGFIGAFQVWIVDIWDCVKASWSESSCTKASLWVSAKGALMLMVEKHTKMLSVGDPHLKTPLLATLSLLWRLVGSQETSTATSTGQIDPEIF